MPHPGVWHCCFEKCCNFILKAIRIKTTVMKAAEIKLDLLKQIDGMNVHQLKDIYGLLQNYFNSNNNTEEWEILTTQQKEKIENGIIQADAKITKPANEVINRLKKKYGLND
jgi:hypothetical protein